mgnify:CR=1 FL=1
MSEKDNMNHNELENEVEKVDDKDVVVEDQKKDDDEYEKVCFICHRPGKPDRQDDGSAESYQCVSGLHAEEL